MKGREKVFSFIIVIILLVSGLVWGTLEDKRRGYYEFPDALESSDVQTSDLSDKAIAIDEPLISSVPGQTNYYDKKMFVDDEFTSNLPLIVIDTNDQVPQIGSVWDKEQGYYVPIEEDPYAYGDISIIDNKDGSNSPKDSVSLHSDFKIKIRGNSSSNYDKKQYLLKLLNKDGKSNSENVLGMGSDDEWILNVSFIDKSLLRNYLAYTAGGEVMPYTPDARFCEVLWKDGDQYRYEGVYMMLESVKCSKHRVDLPQFSENSKFAPALLRRDRYNANGIMLENYATVNGLTPGYLDIEYPSQKDITDKGIQKITKQISQFEESLYSDDWDSFVKYRDFVNMDSFVDYFVINEFFLNYDAGYNSTYTYIDYSGKLNMGPLWDFDQAMDNNATIPATLTTTAFHSAPWFDRMLQDPIFVDKLINRYNQLRESILSDESIQNFVYSTIDYLGPAIKRDWARWGYYYSNGDYLQWYKTQTGSETQTNYVQEVDRVLNALSEHGAWLDEHMDSLYQFKKISLEDAQVELEKPQKDYGPLLAVVFVGVFLISIMLVNRRERE